MSFITVTIKELFAGAAKLPSDARRVFVPFAKHEYVPPMIRKYFEGFYLPTEWGRKKDDPDGTAHPFLILTFRWAKEFGHFESNPTMWFKLFGDGHVVFNNSPTKTKDGEDTNWLVMGNFPNTFGEVHLFGASTRNTFLSSTQLFGAHFADLLNDEKKSVLGIPEMENVETFTDYKARMQKERKAKKS